MSKKHHIAQNTMSEAVDLALSRLYIPRGVTVVKTKRVFKKVARKSMSITKKRAK